MGVSIELLGYVSLFLALLVKNPPVNKGGLRDVGLTPGLGRSSGEGHGNPLQYSCLQDSMDRGAWQPMAHGFSKSPA